MIHHSQKGHYYTSKPRREVLKVMNLLKPNSSVIDIGAGYGNNTKVLLNQGYKVTALETNPAAIKALRQIDSGDLTVLSRPVDKVTLTNKYELVINCMVLHFLENERIALDVITKMKTWTQPGGLNVVTSYLDSNSLDDEYSFLLRSSQLRKLYDDWQIVFYEESYTLALNNIRSHKDIIRLLRGKRGYKAARLIAKRPVQ